MKLGLALERVEVQVADNLPLDLGNEEERVVYRTAPTDAIRDDRRLVGLGRHRLHHLGVHQPDELHGIAVRPITETASASCGIASRTETMRDPTHRARRYTKAELKKTRAVDEAARAN